MSNWLIRIFLYFGFLVFVQNSYAANQLNECAAYDVVTPHVHVVKVNLNCSKKFRIIGTPESVKGMTTSEFSKLTGSSISINAGYFREGFFPFGLTVTDGRVWLKARDLRSRVFLGCDSKNVCFIEDFEKESIVDSGMMTVVSGWQALNNGEFECAKPVEFRCMNEKFTMRHPRTAVGLSDDGTVLFIIVVEGRLKSFSGYSLHELSELFKSFNVHRAVNMDGGGSSTLVINGIRKNKLPDKQVTERVVTNHFGIGF